MSTSTARQTFRETVAAVAAAAKAKLPQAVNGRVESAVKLVLWQDVEPQADGSILVGSSTDPLKTYRLVGATCECQDFTRGQAPAGWCQHRIAAGIQKHVQQLLPSAPEPASAHESPAVPLPEAPASVNVRVTIGSREVQWTLRDTDEGRLAVRLAELLQRYPLPQPAPQASRPEPAPAEQRYCPKHGDKMQQNHKEGRSWWSHRTAEGWCKGK